jgi:hypothetical protein
MKRMMNGESSIFSIVTRTLVVIARESKIAEVSRWKPKGANRARWKFPRLWSDLIGWLSWALSPPGTPRYEYRRVRPLMMSARAR